MSNPTSGSTPRKRGPLGGRSPVRGPVEKAKDFKGSMKKLLQYLGKYKFRIFLVMGTAMLSTIFTIVGPKVLGNATTEIFNGIMGKIAGTGTGIDFGRIAQILLFLLGLYLVSLVFSYLQGWIMTGVSMRVTYHLRNDIMKKINRMPLNYFDTTSHGEVLSRVTNDIDTLSQTLNQSITQIITSVTMVVGIIAMMFSISWQLTLVALCVIPVSLVFILIIVKHSQKYFAAQQEYLGHVNGHVEEMYGGHTVMKAFNGEEASMQQFDQYNETLYKSAWKSQFLSGLMQPVMNFVANVGYVAVCIVGGWLAAGGRLMSAESRHSFSMYVSLLNRSHKLPISATFFNRPQPRRSVYLNSLQNRRRPLIHPWYTSITMILCRIQIRWFILRGAYNLHMSSLAITPVRPLSMIFVPVFSPGKKWRLSDRQARERPRWSSF